MRMKNYIRDGQKLPLFGIGPYMIAGMGGIGLLGIVFSGNVLRSGILSGAWIWASCIAGVICIVFGLLLWYVAAVKSDMNNHIAENKLKTDGIYAWVRNPMYSAWMFLIFGIVLLWHNLWLLLVFPIDWVIMAVVLKRTEEKWLRKQYGEEYERYCRHVNRCIPFRRSK